MMATTIILIGGPKLKTANSNFTDDPRDEVAIENGFKRDPDTFYAKAIDTNYVSVFCYFQELGDRAERQRVRL